MTSGKIRLFSRGGGGGNGGVLAPGFARYVPLASQNPHPIIVYPVTSYRLHRSHFWANVIASRLLNINAIPPRGGGGGEKCSRQFQLSRTFLIFKQYLPNVDTFTKIYWATRFWKNFASRVSHVAMATTFSTPCLLKF